MDLTPGPFPAGKGSPCDDLGLGMALDCGFRRNDGRLGAIHRAPTKNLPLSDMAPRAEGGRVGPGVDPRPVWIAACAAMTGPGVALGKGPGIEADDDCA